MPSYERAKVKDIKTHEEIIENKLIETLESIMEEGLNEPILVDEESRVVLDGHHRLKSFQILGIRSIPVREVNYFSEVVELECRRGFEVEKEDVIEMGRSDRNFPAKTTKHIFNRTLKNEEV